MKIQEIRGFTAGKGIRLRPYKPGDCSALRSVTRAIGEGVLGWGLRNWEEAYEWPQGPCWTAEIGREPVGFAASSDCGNGVMLLHSDLVHPEQQRRGVGTALTLLRMATSDTAEIETLALLATHYSMPFYRRFGFHVHGEPMIDHFLKLTLFQMTLPYTVAISDAAHALLCAEGVEMEYENAMDTRSEQVGAGQPATRAVDEPEGGDKPQPEAEGRSR